MAAGMSLHALFHSAVVGAVSTVVFGRGPMEKYPSWKEIPMAKALYITALLVGSIVALTLIPVWAAVVLVGIIIAWYRGWRPGNRKP